MKVLLQYCMDKNHLRDDTKFGFKLSFAGRKLVFFIYVLIPIYS